MLTCSHGIRSSYFLRLVPGALLLFAGALLAEDRPASRVFAKWRSGQRVFSDLDLRAYRRLDDAFLDDFRQRFPVALRPQAGFLRIPAGTRPLSGGEREALRAALKPLVDELEDPRDFLRYLKKKNFATSAVDAAEKKASFRTVSTKYRSFLEALLGSGEEESERRALFAAANRFFEYCFFPRRHGDCMQLARNPVDHPLLRLIYSNMWYHLSGVGWQHWHASALDELERRARAGDEIVYIAGGTDIYELLGRGMTKLRVIDPIFPSQTKYYAEGWRFLVEPSGRGQDRILFTERDDGADYVLVREEHRVTGRFASGELSDKSKRTLPRSHTVWAVYDGDGKKTGSVVFERRFVEQKDFAATGGRTFLISFNEMNYLAATDTSGWGLKPADFPASFRMVVKQLRKPVSRKVLVNLEEMRNSDFYFIKLGTSIN